jgi:SSS family solute:Na+ symporter
LTTLQLPHLIALVATLTGVALLGFISGRRVRSAADFTGSNRRATASVVAGTITGTLVGGASTIGTAQLAFAHGLCAWWFTLGAGLGCLLLGAVLARPVRARSALTVSELLVGTYGGWAGPAVAGLSSVSMFLVIVAQLLSGVALLTAMLDLPSPAAAGIVAVLMLTYVLFGGVLPTGCSGS